MTSMRDDFSQTTKQKLAARVNYYCSNPNCRASTSGPQSDPTKALNIGVAAHIRAAASGGPRYDARMTKQQRSSIENGMWLCENCGKLIDNDKTSFTIEVLKEWKETAEKEALLAIGKTKVLETPKVNWVNNFYPEKAGITQELTAQGYKSHWVNANREVEKVKLEGWEYVVDTDSDGSTARLKIKDIPSGGYSVLLKKKIS